MASYCFRCHGPDRHKADRRFDTLDADLSQIDMIERWQDVVDQLNLSQMPPEGAKQPPAAETKAVIEWITNQLAAAHAERKSTGGQTVLRRLNRTEYDRTVRDLLSLEDMLADPTESFPPDETQDGFDNVGSALVMSDFLLKQCLDAAELLVSHAAAYGDRPEARKYHFAAPFCPTGNRHDGQDVPSEYQHIRKNTSDEGGHLWLARMPEGVPQAGYYRLRVKAQAVNRDYPYSERFVGVRKSEPLRMGVVLGSSAYGFLENRTTSDREVAEFELPDDAPQWLETTIWLDAGYQPRLTFLNGPNRVKPLRAPLVQAYPESFRQFIVDYLVPDYAKLPDNYRIAGFEPADVAVVDPAVEAPRSKSARRSKSKQPQASNPAQPPSEARRLTTAGTSVIMNSREGWASFFREYQGPRVRVYEIELEGPLYDQWPPASHLALYGDCEPKLDQAEAILRRFATRAFRRPVAEDELAQLTALVDARRERGDSDQKAIEAGLKAVLCSPSFLYLAEQPGPLDDYAIASRLSYFLWSTMPDDELLSLAAEGRLREPEVIEAQARRMLAGARSEIFTDRFTSRWLELYKIGSMPPDPNRFRAYYIDGLETAMKEETRLYFRHVLDQNLPIERFLDSDFTFVNGALARLYGIEGVSGNEFRQVRLDDARRGGLLGQASILTASANGIDTSPVIRGIWVLENVLGTPPAPPPPDVEPLEPDIRGATTIRDQLKKHRDVQTCAECHQKIDPLGFALENFDPVGAWRDKYVRGSGAGPRVDPSGELPDGRQFADVVELKQILLDRRDQFAHCLTEKLLAYALGRPIEVSDRPTIDALTADLEARGNGLQDLMLLVVRSQAFRTK